MEWGTNGGGLARCCVRFGLFGLVGCSENYEIRGSSSGRKIKEAKRAESEAKMRDLGSVYGYIRSNFR